jgi:hypothetical protein
MRTALRQPSRLVGLAALGAAFLLAVAGNERASAAHARPSSGGVTVVGYSSEPALRRAVTRSGGRIVRRIPALHVAVVKSAPAAAQVLSRLPGIRYADEPVYRHELVDPGIASAPVPGGAYEWQYCI